MLAYLFSLPLWPRVCLTAAFILLIFYVALWLLRRFVFSRRQAWLLHPYSGGAPISFRGSKEQAISYCAKTHGVVTYTDELHGFIFYKPFGWKPSA